MLLLDSENISKFQQEDEISIYKGHLTDSNIVIELAKAKIAFPVLPVDFFTLLSDRLKANHFTDERLHDAIAHVIDTCPYPTPTIANFISFDKKFKVFTFEEMLKKLDDYGQDKKFWDSYKSIQFSDREKRVWVHIDDIKRYKLKND